MNSRSSDFSLALGIYALNRLVTLFGSMVWLGHQMSLSKMAYLSTIWSGIHDDSGWFGAIAAHGYWAQDTPFFPGYPLLISVLQHASGVSLAVSGLLVSNIFFILDLYLMIRLGKRLWNARTGLFAAALFGLYPVAFYLTSMYSESLFIWAILAAWLSLVEDRPITAGVYAAVATLTRNEGVLLALPIFGYVWNQYKVERLIPVRGLIGLSLVPVALVSYLGYLWATFGDPMLFSHMESLWGREFMIPFLTLYHGFTTIPYLWSVGDWYARSYFVLVSGSVLLTLAALPYLWREVPRSWFFFVVAMIAIPLSDPGIGTETIVMHPEKIQDYFFSFDRFVLPMVPLFYVLALRLSNIRWYGFTLAASGASLGALSIPMAYHLFLG